MDLLPHFTGRKGARRETRDATRHAVNAEEEGGKPLVRIIQMNGTRRAGKDRRKRTCPLDDELFAANFCRDRGSVLRATLSQAAQNCNATEDTKDHFFFLPTADPATLKAG